MRSEAKARRGFDAPGLCDQGRSRMSKPVREVRLEYHMRDLNGR
eukprot:SAG11_NODE_13703_length_643_cov_0.507353_1_plen_44_part_00